MSKHKAIPEGYMTVGEVAKKKWTLLYGHYSTTIEKAYFPHLP